jgi:hypothetical protein
MEWAEEEEEKSTVTVTLFVQVPEGVSYRDGVGRGGGEEAHVRGSDGTQLYQQPVRHKRDAY